MVLPQRLIGDKKMYTFSDEFTFLAIIIVTLLLLLTMEI